MIDFTCNNLIYESHNISIKLYKHKIVEDKPKAKKARTNKSWRAYN